jgi:integrase
MDFRTAAAIYLEDAERRFVEKTFKYKRYVYRSFKNLIGNMAMRDITPQILNNYLMTRKSNYNYNVHRKELSALFTFAQRRLKIISYNPCWDLEKMPHTPTQKIIPTEEQILKLLQAADPEYERPLITILLHTAARVDEILRLTWADIHFEKRKITRWTRKRKGGSYEPILTAMNKELYETLKRLWEKRQHEKWVFYNVKTGYRYNHRPKLMKSLCKKACIDPHFGFHAIRHFTASYLADAENVSKKTISGILGHKSLQTTELYLHGVDESQKSAMKILEKISSKASFKNLTKKADK